MANSTFGRRFHDLKYFEVRFFPFFLNPLYTRRHNKKNLEKNQFNF